MNEHLCYNNLITELDRQFPEFCLYLGDAHQAMQDHVAVYFSFFSIYVKENWADDSLHQQLARLLQQMHASADEATQLTLNDFLLDVCSSCKEHGLNLSLLGQHLEAPLQSRLAQINHQWMAAACQLPRGCC